MTINIKLIGNGQLPTQGTPGAAAYDVYVRAVEIEYQNAEKAIAKYKLGFATEIPDTHYAELFPRSSNLFNHRLVNSVGIIDSDYRGEWMMKFYVDTNFEGIYKVGDRCGQFLIKEKTPVHFNLVDELSETTRGKGGFGSTGA